MSRLYTYKITANYLEAASVSLNSRDVSGFTGHEPLYAFNLINMNGRNGVNPEWLCYFGNPMVSRMLSPDNYIQAPDFSQSFNRYPYCMNNPINLVDKSGYYWLDYDYDWNEFYENYLYEYHRGDEYPAVPRAKYFYLRL